MKKKIDKNKKSLVSTKIKTPNGRKLLTTKILQAASRIQQTIIPKGISN
jgi:hypothetical protein